MGIGLDGLNPSLALIDANPARIRIIVCNALRDQRIDAALAAVLRFARYDAPTIAGGHLLTKNR